MLACAEPPAAPLAPKRARAPEATLAAIAPHLGACGITRSASVTGLDDLGVPTWVAIRPNGLVLQVSNGKGLSDAAARVSALMEAIELHHAETPLAARLVRASAADLRAGVPAGARVLLPDDLPAGLQTYWHERFAGEWTHGTDMAGGAAVWAPSSAVYFCRRPGLHETSSNGLASGNTGAEAALHALYELIERDAMCRLRAGGRIRLRGRARVVDVSSLPHPPLRAIVERATAVGTRVVLVALPTAVPVHAFWAVLVGSGALAPVSSLNVGWGAHVDPGVAAARALTEAAQSRLGFIHGGRDDIVRKPVSTATEAKSSAAFRFFAGLAPDCGWADVAAKPTLPLRGPPEADVSALVSALADAGLGPPVLFDLSCPDKRIPVVRVICPGLGFDKALF